ncbi:MAG TPA: hypothetical protein ENH28_06475 [Euryarchaeota archaeon]|nr:hypothetical protein BMS3Bbin15_01337 [archaeon BMS3Bbin15]HDL15776.1 hypothetical protein [Euryarchaeota archaeon]
MAEGSDPGLCITSGRDVKNTIVQFDIKAQNEVLNKKMAYALAKDENLFLTEYGGTGDGIIGALSAVGLTAGGNNGRFIEFGKIREFMGYLKAGELETNGMNAISETLTPIPSGDIINTMNWVRPRLYNGTPTLMVEKKDGCWESIDRKKR